MDFFPGKEYNKRKNRTDEGKKTINRKKGKGR
jgi:hypothetical protein